MKAFITELGVVPSALGPMEIYRDNNGAIAQAKEPRSHLMNKHVSRKYHLIRQFVGEGVRSVDKDSVACKACTTPGSHGYKIAIVNYNY